MDGNMEMDNIIELMDENDNPVHFEHLMTLEHEGEEYVLLVPVDPIEDVGEDEVIIPVSYTHLDVYKRQPPWRPLVWTRCWRQGLI